MCKEKKTYENVRDYFNQVVTTSEEERNNKLWEGLIPYLYDTFPSEEQVTKVQKGLSREYDDRAIKPFDPKYVNALKRECVEKVKSKRM